MGRSVRYHPWFGSDVLDAVHWYDDRSVDLGVDFVERVSKCVDQLVEDPERRSPADHGIRYWPVGRFPYVVFYDVTDREVLIVGVMHTSRELYGWLAARRGSGGGLIQ